MIKRFVKTFMENKDVLRGWFELDEPKSYDKEND